MTTIIKYAMLTLDFTYESELAVMRRFGLTPDELFITRAILLSQDSKRGLDYLHQFADIADNKKLIIETLPSLQEKGIVLKSCNVEKGMACSAIQFNKNATKYIYRAAREMGNELLNVYPSYAMINGTYVGLKGVSKRFNSIEDALDFYGRAIKWNPETHNWILGLTKWAAEETSMINCSFSSYIIDSKWEFLDEMKSGKQGNINFDNVRIL